MKKAVIEGKVLKLSGDWSELAQLIKEKTGVEQNFDSIQFTTNPFQSIQITKTQSNQDILIEKYKFKRVNQNFKMEIDPFLAKYLAICFGKDVRDDTNIEEPVPIKFKENGKEHTLLVSFASKQTDESDAKYGYLTILKPPEISEDNLFPLIMKHLDPIGKLIRYKYLCTCLEYPPSSDDLPLPYEEEELHYDFFEKTRSHNSLSIPLSRDFTSQDSITIPVPTAINLVEIFALNQLDSEKCMVNKDFLKFPKVYMLEIPFKVPVLFKFSNGSIILSFKEHCGISVKEQSNYFKNITTRFMMRQQHISVFQNVIPNKISSSLLIEKEKELGFCFLKDDETKYQNKKSVQYCIYMISNEIGPKEKQQVQKFKDFTFDLYKQCAIYLCEVCGYKSTNNNPCPPYQHSGVQLPLPDGKMSKTVNIGGIVTEQRNYSCCGIVNLAFDEGCSKESHHSYPECKGNVESIFSFQ